MAAHEGRGSPGVRGLLGATTLQLLHQHFAAAPQGISELPKGATAPQGAIAILWNSQVCPCHTGYMVTWPTWP